MNRLKRALSKRATASLEEMLSDPNTIHVEAPLKWVPPDDIEAAVANAMSEWTKDQWLVYIQTTHDRIALIEGRRNRAIVRACSDGGVSAAEVARALGPRMTAEGVRKILRKYGVKPSGRRGPKPGVKPPIPPKSGLGHL
jgi:hypothetical protein